MLLACPVLHVFSLRQKRKGKKRKTNAIETKKKQGNPYIALSMTDRLDRRAVTFF